MDIQYTVCLNAQLPSWNLSVCQHTGLKPSLVLELYGNETERHIILFRDPAQPQTLADWNAEKEQIRSGWRCTGGCSYDWERKNVRSVVFGHASFSLQRSLAAASWAGRVCWGRWGSREELSGVWVSLCWWTRETLLRALFGERERGGGNGVTEITNEKGRRGCYTETTCFVRETNKNKPWTDEWYNTFPKIIYY